MATRTAWFRVGYAISNPLTLLTEDPCGNERVSANYATGLMFVAPAVGVLGVATIPAGAAALTVFGTMGGIAGGWAAALGNVANAHGNFAYCKGQNPNYYMRRT